MNSCYQAFQNNTSKIINISFSLRLRLKIDLKTILGLLFILFLNSRDARTSTLEALPAHLLLPEEATFLKGYSAFLNRQFFACAEALEPLQYHFDRLSHELHQRALLYLAYCLEGEERSDEAAQRVKVLQQQLPTTAPQWSRAQDQNHWIQLLQRLKNQIDILNHRKIWFFPYGGWMEQKPKITSFSGKILGLSAGLTQPHWSLQIGIESAEIPFFPEKQSGFKLLRHLSLEQKLSAFIQLRENLSHLQTTFRGLNSGVFLGLGLTYSIGGQPWSRTQIELDGYSSHYTGMDLGRHILPVQVLQATLTVRHLFTHYRHKTLFGYLSSENIFPSAPFRLNENNGFYLAPFYERITLGCTLTLATLDFDLQAWFGPEALGIRKSGREIHSILQTFLYGGAFEFQWQLSKNIYWKTTLFIDFFSPASNQNILSKTYLGGLNLNF